MINQVVLMGRLTRDPSLKYTKSNVAVCSFTLAVERSTKSADGNRQSDFIPCVIWGKSAEFVSKWFAKGYMATVIGELQSRSWVGEDGKNRSKVEVKCDKVDFGETKKSREATSGSYAPSVDADENCYSFPNAEPDFQEVAGDDDITF